MSKGLALVTGADGGMGTIHTRTLLQNGYDVIMACYDTQVARPVFEKMQTVSKNQVFLMQVDLGSLQSVKHFAEEVLNQFSSLQIVLNNAGVLCHKAKESIDGVEYTVAVNYLGHYVLNHLLLPIMGRGTRIVSMVSLSYKWSHLKPNFLDPKTDKNFNRFVQYANSKLGLFYYTMDAAKRWKERGICINVADPGVVDTGIICQGNKLVDFLCDKIYRPLINTPEEGAATMLAAALNPEFEGVTGCYFKNKKICPQRKKYTDNVQEQQILREMTQKTLRRNGIELDI